VKFQNWKILLDQTLEFVMRAVPPVVLAATAVACSTASARTPVALTLSGGVSLGAYQAGALYYVSRWLKANPDLFDAKLMTGASAGALNTLFSVFSICGQETHAPSESAFFHAWVGFEGKELLVEPSDSEAGRALFSRKALEKIAASLETKWKGGLPTSCDVVIGLSVTRLHERADFSKIGFSRQGEKVTLRIRGQGLGRAPKITNYVNPSLFRLFSLEGGTLSVKDQ
jgi:hypothetical protein